MEVEVAVAEAVAVEEAVAEAVAVAVAVAEAVAVAVAVAEAVAVAVAVAEAVAEAVAVAVALEEEVPVADEVALGLCIVVGDGAGDTVGTILELSVREFVEERLLVCELESEPKGLVERVVNKV